MYVFALFDLTGILQPERFGSAGAEPEPKEVHFGAFRGRLKMQRIVTLTNFLLMEEPQYGLDWNLPVAHFT